MSDTSQGQGWWQASDGKWYAPELYPNDWPAPNAAVTTATGTSSEHVENAAPERSDDTFSEALTNSVFDTPAVADPAPDHGAPSGDFQMPDPAADEPTVANEIPPIPSVEANPTTVQERISVTPESPVWDPPPVSPLPEPDLATPPTSPASPPHSWDEQPEFTSLGSGHTTPSTEPGSAPDMVGGVLGLLGGAALIVGSFLAWASAVGPNISGEINGLTGSNGWGTLVAGLAVAITASVALAGLRKLWVGAFMAVAALVGLGLGIFSMLDINSTSDDLPATLKDGGVAPEIADATSLDLDLGLWIALVGGAVSLVAALIVLARRQS